MKNTLIIAFIFIVFSANAPNITKIKIVSGDLTFLKGQKNLLVEFRYSPSIHYKKISDIPDYDSTGQREGEKEFNGEMWIPIGMPYRERTFQPKFIEQFNEYLESKDIGLSISEVAPDTEYKMIVITTNMEEGYLPYNKDSRNKPAYISLEISFQRIKPYERMAFISTSYIYINAQKTPEFYFGNAYGRAGKMLAKFLRKNKAF